MDRNNNGVVLLVDEDRFVLEAASMLLGIHGYRVIMCEEAEEAVAVLEKESLDVVLSDVCMLRARSSGLIGAARESASCPPVLVMSGHQSVDSALDELKKGAYDLIVKPYRPEHLLVKVERAIEYSKLRRVEKVYSKTLEDSVRRATDDIVQSKAEMREATLELVCRLAGAAEFRETGPFHHASRVGLYAGRVAGQMGLGAEFVEAITFAAPVHDIGMAGIPGDVLFKPGPLTVAEFEIVKTHTMAGHRLLDGSCNSKLRMAATVALTHHERWDGSGYPCGLKGSEVPLEGMITMICDRYDALRSRRPYRPPLGHNEAMEIITGGNGRSKPDHFNPLVLEAFKKVATELDGIFASSPDAPESCASPDLLRIG